MINVDKESRGKSEKELEHGAETWRPQRRTRKSEMFS